MLGPILWAILQEDAKVITQWIPLTTRGGGLFHMAMMAIIGVTAWGRTQEKINMSPLGFEVQRETVEIGHNEKNKKDEFSDEPPPVIKRKLTK